MKNCPSSEAVFRALADPTRRAILDALRGGPRPVGQIAERFEVSRPAISKHLRILRQARLVAEVKQGRLRWCKLNPGPLRQIDVWLSHYREFWAGKLGRLKRNIETGQ